MRTVKCVLFVLLVVLAMTSCASVPTAQDLTGMWASIPTSQAGAITATYCFSKDGSVRWTSQVQGRTHRVIGTYKLVGDALTIESQDLDAPAKLKASLSMGKLELTSPSGSSQKYAKESGSCDDTGR